MKIRGKVMGVLLAGCLLLASGCTQEVKNSFTAVDYVDSVIQSIYQGEHKEYEEIVGIDEDEAEEGYRDKLYSEAVYFGERFGFVQNEKTLYRTMAFYRRLYSQCKYEVLSSEKTDTGCIVTMEVSPVNLFVTHADELENRVLTFSKLVSEGLYEGETQTEIECWYCNYLLDYLEAQLDQVSWDESREITIELAEKDGAYLVGEEELQTIDQSLVLYSEEKSPTVSKAEPEAS